MNGIGLYWQSIEALVLIPIATYPGTLKFVISPFFDKECTQIMEVFDMGN